jgi:hypothetical protein
MYFVFIYENRTMRPIELVLRRRGGEMMETNGGSESN